MRSDVAIGHEATLAGLWQAAASGRLPHAFLFVGPDGCGKFLAAEQLTAGLVCANGPGTPCGSCGPETRLRSGTHPDVFVIDPLALEEETIPVARIAPRETSPLPNVGEFLALRPMESRWRVVLVREAHRMNVAAQNAFLKTLEEPGGYTVIVLETAYPDRLLPTIHSRCTHVPLRGPNRSEAARVLQAHGLESERALQLARWSRGAPGRALGLAAREAEALRAGIVATVRGDRDPLDVAAAVFALEGDFGAGTARALARERARTFLDLLLDVTADLARARAGVDPDELAHGDVVTDPALAALVSGPDADDRLARLLETGLRARQDIDANLAPDAVLESCLLAFAPAPTPSR